MILFKKRLFVVFFVLLSSTLLFSQTSLPTSWNCNPGTIPVGWTTDITGYYTSSSYTHSPPNAIKFETTGMYLTINFVDEPDTLLYYLRGAITSGTFGTFTVQESGDGTSWSAVRTFTSANIPNSNLATAAPFKDALNINTRFVRFFYTYKNSGNVSVDDILITKRPPGPEANIKIKFNNMLVATGGTAIVGNVSAATFRVINSGTDSVLRITSAFITGIDSSMFSISGIPLNVPPSDSATFMLNFSPSGADGTKLAALSLPNNDADKTPYVINVWAVKGCCATSPSGPAANLTLSDVKSYKFNVGFTDGVGIPDKYLVLKKSSPITETPANGQTYLKGSYIGTAQVAYMGSAGIITPSNVIANTHYYIKVFPCNGYPGYENYLTDSVASADITTPANMIGPYYDAINSSAPQLWTDLHNLINNHFQLFYSDYSTYLINNFYSRDTVDAGRSQKAITCAYSGENYVYTDPFAFTVYSREHAFCQSWMATVNEPNFTSLPEYSDYHNLFPTNQNKVNVYRSNYPLGKVVTVQYQYLGCKKGLDSLNRIVFEPVDNIKGDVARAMFYQILCYDGVNGNDWFLPLIISSPSIPYGQDAAILKKWNQQDLPDNYEMARNDYICSVQNNRNPFIDNPQWANLFAFDIYTALDKNNDGGYSMQVFPNPSDGLCSVVSQYQNDSRFELFDCKGINIFSTILQANSASTIDLRHLANGSYFYRIFSKDIPIKQDKLIISR